MSEGIKCKAENRRNIRTVGIKYVHVVPAFIVTVRMCFRRAREVQTDLQHVHRSPRRRFVKSRCLDDLGPTVWDQWIGFCVVNHQLLRLKLFLSALAIIVSYHGKKETPITKFRK